MWRYYAFFFCFASVLEEYSANDFCADLNPQTIINVPQLMGIWYVVERIDHLDERHYSKKSSTCSIIHISEDKHPTTLSPLYRGNQFRGYGDGFGYGSDRSQYEKTQEQFERERQQRLQYNRDDTYDRSQPRNHYQTYNMDKRHLRIHWDEENSSGTTEYHVWYNISEPGFWISSGRENGAALKKQFSHYAGNIQVLKVVRDHMVLTFCHQVPHQYFSVILSRQTTLNALEILSVHGMLNRNNMKTSAVEKQCNSGIRITLSSLLLIVSLITYADRLLSLKWHIFS